MICSAAFSVAVLADSEEQFKTGDVDKNSSINIKDATLVQKYVAGIVELDEEALLLADTDANSNVNVKDATLIQKFVAGLVAEFPQKNDKPTDTPTQAPSSASVATDEVTSAAPTEEPSQALPTEGASQPTPTEPVTEPSTAPVQIPTKPSVDSDGYFDVVIRP